ncbi:MAG: type 4a pilus biogenesis protein PilO [Candidatus Omnitrophica bacterium]|nr:type 4a pilus biogenesis protein PilO [Candidatus Omnitrophota bacterium]
MPNNSKKVNKVSYVVIFTSVFIGVWLLVYFFVGRPVLKYSDGLKAEFGSKQAKLQESQELVRSLPDPQKAIFEIKGKLQEFQDLGVSKKQIPRLMQLLGQTASDRQITVLSLRPREDVKNDETALPPGINKIYLEITLTCTYQVLADYIKAINELPTAFKVETLTVEKGPETLAPADAKSGSKNPGEASKFLKAVLLLSTISG